MNIIDLLTARGFVDQMTSPELRALTENPIGVYLGLDPTADSFHLGNLMGLMALAWFQKCGHKVYALVGGATGRIGDPSGKSVERPLLSEEELAHNVASLTAFLKKLLSFPEGVPPVVVNNHDWLGKIGLIDFLREAGKHFRVGSMIAKESVRARLQSEEGISFTEFSYQVLQGYDFCFLSKQYGISLQVGGSDQWGNITAGVELNRKTGGKPLFGLTWPLLTRSDGKKFGKSEEGAVWLSSEKLSPYHFYQYLVRVPDVDVIRLLKILTFIPLSEISKIEQEMEVSGYVPNTAQKKLAEEVTRFIHGEEGLAAALRVTMGMMPGEAAGGVLSAKVLKELAQDMPHISLSRSDVVGIKFVDLASKIGLVPSKAEGGRLIKNGGAYLNNERISDPNFFIQEKDLIEGIYLLFSSGKKKRILVEIEN
ncbi:MAG TPA: tyrosine--tRNA ligase [Chlamydiales bacterium]|nr:tyrosine--tRNA ligase [Chlamydiales bacterium]